MMTWRRMALLSCLACAANAPAQAQQRAPQVYGRLNLALEQVHADGQRDTRLSNNRSVIGVRGSEALGEGKALVYQVEGTVALDTGNGALAARDTRVGLQGPWGILFGGNWSTPYNSATSGLDPFYPTTAGYVSIMGNGAAPNSGNLEDTASFDRRQKNSVHYWTPAWHGLTLRLAHGLGEERPADGAHPALDSAALLFEGRSFSLVLAGERHREYQGRGVDDYGRKVALIVPVGATRIALAGEELSYASGQLRRRAVFLSLTHQLGPHSLRLAVARAGDGHGREGMQAGSIRAGPGSGALHVTLGYDRQLSKRTGLYAYYTRLRNEPAGTANFAINSVETGPGATLSAFAVGLRHGF